MNVQSPVVLWHGVFFNSQFLSHNLVMCSLVTEWCMSKILVLYSFTWLGQGLLPVLAFMCKPHSIGIGIGVPCWSEWSFVTSSLVAVQPLHDNQDGCIQFGYLSYSDIYIWVVCGGLCTQDRSLELHVLIRDWTMRLKYVNHSRLNSQHN